MEDTEIIGRRRAPRLGMPWACPKCPRRIAAHTAPDPQRLARIECLPFATAGPWILPRNELQGYRTNGAAPRVLGSFPFVHPVRRPKVRH
jgi:hypothetical protein